MGRHSAAAPPQRPAGVVVVVALVLGLALAGGLYYLLRQSDDGAGVAAPEPSTSASSCPSAADQVRVAVTPNMMSIVQAAAARVTATNPCVTYTVFPSESAKVAAAFSSGSRDAPALWVSDSSVFVNAVKAARPDAIQPDVQKLATSPLVFAVPAVVAAKAGPALAGAAWSSLAAGDGSIPVRLTDPEKTTSGRLVLLTAPTALGDSPTTRLTIGRTLLAWSHSTMPTESDLFLAARSPQAAIFPTSEQAVAADLKLNAGAVTALVPKEGTARYDYSLVTAAGSPGITVAGIALKQQLTNDDGRSALTAAGFRLPDTEATGPGVPGMPSGAVTYLPDPSAAQQATLVRTWTGVKTDSRMLALIDTSGSMREKEGDKTRMALAGEAAQTAISIFPNAAQVGLWTFGIDRGGPGQDWKEIVPIRQLDEAVEGKPQRQVLGEALPGLVDTAAGGTGLYDSLLAAYKQMVTTYVPGRVNSVILLTDGRNDDQAGISLEKLLGDISALKDPNKPVVIVTIGMGQDVDTSSLSAVSTITGGKTYLAQNPQDINQVFIDALLSRDCSGAVCTSR
ncbi:MAG TPA: VWA domain-containing protein [Lapillicoccus sp.]|nr:VWA domain-containing protein [Lapillicoccus sp.]